MAFFQNSWMRWHSSKLVQEYCKKFLTCKNLAVSCKKKLFVYKLRSDNLPGLVVGKLEFDHKRRGRNNMMKYGKYGKYVKYGPKIRQKNNKNQV